MSKTQHTPGPWETTEPRPRQLDGIKGEAGKVSSIRLFHYSGPIRSNLADIYGNDDEQCEANAALIAAAPETAAERDRLKEENLKQHAKIMKLEGDAITLKALNAELVVALQEAVNTLSGGNRLSKEEVCKKAMEAIRKAKGE